MNLLSAFCVFSDMWSLFRMCAIIFIGGKFFHLSKKKTEVREVAGMWPRWDFGIHRFSIKTLLGKLISNTILNLLRFPRK